MSPEELAGWEASFSAFHERFADLFARSESREQAAKYLRGLLAPVQRKNGWDAPAAPTPCPRQCELIGSRREAGGLLDRFNDRLDLLQGAAQAGGQAIG